MKSDEILDRYGLYIIGVIALLVLFNWYELSSFTAAPAGSAFHSSSSFIPTFGKSSSSDKMIATSSGGIALKVVNTGDAVQDAITALIPTGTPAYGNELSVSYDDPAKSLAALANLDYQIPTKTLTAEEKQRFVDVGTKISCEFCCSAPAVIDQNGRDLCGCAHAASFRGLAKYLIKAHPNDYSDDQILLELTRWKSLYYPRNMVEKASALINNRMELTAANLNDRQLLSKLSSGDTSSIGQLPSMVGGC